MTFLGNGVKVYFIRESWSDAVERNQQELIPVRQHHRLHHHRYHHGVDRCPDGFIYSPATSTCYLLKGEQVTWDVADRHCRGLGARLLTIRSSVEQRQLTELARTNSGEHGFHASLCSQQRS